MTASPAFDLQKLVALSATAGLNRLAEFEVVAASDGAATLVGGVMASHFSMNWLKPAVGRSFVAKGMTIRAGRKQIFAKAELFAENEAGKRTLVATGETLLVPADA
jgi:acyl-coenzyme A thioesterase PaaI-like protein